MTGRRSNRPLVVSPPAEAVPIHPGAGGAGGGRGDAPAPEARRVGPEPVSATLHRLIERGDVRIGDLLYRPGGPGEPKDRQPADDEDARAGPEIVVSQIGGDD